MSAEDDYESLGDNAGVGIHMAAGAAAGVFEHCAMYPLDMIKTRMQSLGTTSLAESGIFSAMRSVSTREGSMALVRGLGVMASGAGPAHALYFASYEKAKEALAGGADSVMATGTAGALATIVHDGFMNPFDVVKQRMQLGLTKYNNAFNVAGSILKTEGIGAFYRSYSTQLTMNIPYQSVHFVVYEKLRAYLNPTGEYNPKAHILAGGAAGAVAAAVTTPLDVVKTLLNTQELPGASSLKGQYITGVFGAARTIKEHVGYAGFFRGMRARVLFHAPSTAICWTVYEFFKFSLAKDKMDQNTESKGLLEFRSPAHEATGRRVMATSAKE
eukprot:Clim_evm47s33 gene=Clim_evmTU47s33